MKLAPLILATGAAAILAGTATATAASTPSCSLASTKRVKAALGITVGSATVTRNGPVTVCLFMSTPALLVRFETKETPALYSYGRKGFSQHHEPTKTVTGLGTSAYSASLAGGKSNTIIVLKGTVELLITGAEPLHKLEALAKLILPSL